MILILMMLMRILTQPLLPALSIHILLTFLLPSPCPSLTVAYKKEGFHKLLPASQASRNDMIRLLTRKYKIMKRRDAQLPIVSVDHDNFYKQLYEIYSIYDKSKVASIEDVMVQYKDKESVLLEQLYDKYNIRDEHHHLLGHGKHVVIGDEY